MIVVILAGGEGKRLRPYTQIFPKPLLPIGDKPVLEIILEKLKKQGIKKVILSVNYKSNLIEQFFGSGLDRGINLIYSKEDTPLGTGGPIKLLKNVLTEDFFVMNGDLITEINVGEVAEFHKKIGAEMTIVTKRVEIPVSFGVIKGGEDYVEKIEEKPVINLEINTGMYMLKPEVLEYIPDNQYFKMTDLVEEIKKRGGKVAKFLYSGKWIDIGQIDDYEEAQKDYYDKDN